MNNTANLPNLSKNFITNLLLLLVRHGANADTDSFEIEINYPDLRKTIASFHFRFVLPETIITPPNGSKKKLTKIDIPEEFISDIVELSETCIRNNSNKCRFKFTIPKIGEYSNLTVIVDIKFKEVTSQPKILQFKKQLNSKR